MVAFALLFIVLIPVSYLLTTVTQQAGDSVQRTTALGLAEQTIETLTSQGPALSDLNGDQLPETGTTEQPTPPTYSIGGVTYTIYYTFDWAQTGETDLCSSGTVPQQLDVSVTVYWGQQQSSITDSTILDYPPSGVPTAGFIGMQIFGDPPNPGVNGETGPPADAEGRNWGGANTGRVTTVPVTFTPVAPTTGSTIAVHADGYGCAFVELPPGTYNITIGPDTLSTQFVTPGSSASTVTLNDVVVSVNQVTTPTPVQYDEGAYLNVTYPNSTTNSDGMTCPYAQNLECLAFGQAPTGAQPNGSTGIVAAASVLSALTNTWTTSALTGISRVESSSCTAVMCIGVGFGPGGAAAVYWNAGVPTQWTPSSTTGYTLPNGIAITTLTQIQCPNQVVCFAIGYGPTGPVLLEASVPHTYAGNVVTWYVDTAATGSVTPTSLTQLYCPSNTACLAIGSAGTAPAIIAVAAPLTAPTAPGQWVSEILPSTISSVSQLTCGGTLCAATATITSTGYATVVSGSASATAQNTWVQEVMPNRAPQTLTQIACPSAAICIATGTTVTTGAPIAIDGLPGCTTKNGSCNANDWFDDTLPSTLENNKTGLTQLTCSGLAGTTACFAIGATSTGSVILSRGYIVAAASRSWTTDTLPSGVTSLTQISCPSAALACVAIGSSGSGPSSAAAVVTGAVSASPEAFTLGTFSGTSPSWLSGIACFGGGETPHCETSGATLTGAVLMGDPALNSGASTWTAAPPTTLAGLHPAGLATTLINSELATSSYTPCQSACGTTIGPVFPFESGYTIGAGNCAAEANDGPTAPSIPGTTPAAAPTETLPMSDLSFQVVNTSGAPVSGATVQVTVDDPVAADESCNTTPETFSFPATGPDGLTQALVILETYSVSVTYNGVTTAAGTVAVNPTESLLTSPSGVETAQLLPGAAVVPQ